MQQRAPRKSKKTKEAAPPPEPEPRPHISSWATWQREPLSVSVPDIQLTLLQPTIDSYPPLPPSNPLYLYHQEEVLDYSVQDHLAIRSISDSKYVFFLFHLYYTTHTVICYLPISLIRARHSIASSLISCLALLHYTSFLVFTLHQTSLYLLYSMVICFLYKQYKSAWLFRKSSSSGLVAEFTEHALQVATKALVKNLAHACIQFIRGSARADPILLGVLANLHPLCQVLVNLAVMKESTFMLSRVRQNHRYCPLTEDLPLCSRSFPRFFSQTRSDYDSRRQLIRVPNHLTQRSSLLKIRAL